MERKNNNLSIIAALSLLGATTVAAPVFAHDHDQAGQDQASQQGSMASPTNDESTMEAGQATGSPAPVLNDSNSEAQGNAAGSDNAEGMANKVDDYNAQGGSSTPAVSDNNEQMSRESTMGQSEGANPSAERMAEDVDSYNSDATGSPGPAVTDGNADGTSLPADNTSGDTMASDGMPSGDTQDAEQMAEDVDAYNDDATGTPAPAVTEEDGMQMDSQPSESMTE